MRMTRTRIYVQQLCISQQSRSTGRRIGRAGEGRIQKEIEGKERGMGVELEAVRFPTHSQEVWQATRLSRKERKIAAEIVSPFLSDVHVWSHSLKKFERTLLKKVL